VATVPTAYVSDLVNLGMFVSARRRRLGRTQMQLGIRLDWYQERVSLLDSGKSGSPSLRVLAKLAWALAVARADILVAVRFLDEPGLGQMGAATAPAERTADSSPQAGS
jgi:Helix-turn-helix domain